MQQWMLTFVNQFGYLGIFLLILIENIFPPIPSEAVLLFGGALTVTTAMNVPGTEHVEKAESWFRRYQGKAVLICRCIPIVRSLISIPAGFAKMPMPGFLLLTTLGSAVWNTVLVCIGSVLGSAWEQAMPYFEQYTHIAAVVIVLAAVVFAVVFLLRWRKKAQGQKLRLPNEEESL